jgi:hypothetical protein
MDVQAAVLESRRNCSTSEQQQQEHSRFVILKR